MAMKQWRRLVSSLLLACLLLGSGGSLVVNASAAGNLINEDLSTWTIPTNNTSTKCVTRSDGVKYFNVSDGTNGGVMVNCRLQPGAKYTLGGGYSVYSLRSSPALIVISVVDYSSGDFLLNYDSVSIVHQAQYTSNTDLRLSPSEFTVPSDFKNPRLFVYSMNFYSLYVSNLVVEDNSTEKGIWNTIKEGFASLWQWLQGIWDSIKEIPAKIAASITSLGDRIRDFFSGLGDRISGFFNDIWEKIKAFFLPSEGYFESYSASFKQFVSDHFGFLADFPEELSLLFNTFVDFTPADPPYIDFPEIKVPMPGKTYTILERQRYTFDFLANQPFSTLYSAYQAFIWLAYCLMLVNLVRRKYAVVFGGASDAD